MTRAGRHATATVTRTDYASVPFISFLYWLETIQLVGEYVRRVAALVWTVGYGGQKTLNE